MSDLRVEPVKVVHISTVDLALRYLLLHQMVAIKSAGFDVYGISAPGPGLPVVESAGIHVISIPMTRLSTPLTDLRALWLLYRTMRRERFTIVHTHTPKAGLLGQYAALLARRPIRLHTIHGLYFPGHMRPEQRWMYVLLERVTMLFSHMNLSQNPEDIPTAIAEKICSPDRIRLLGNGIDITEFDPEQRNPERRVAIRRSIGLDPEHKVVGMVARFVAEKGYLEMLEAARIVAAEMSNVRFVFVGPVERGKKDGLRPEIIHDMELGGVVTFLGHREDVADLYAIMDVLALPSHREGFPRAPMEAASMGVPSVVTNIRGCRQTVTDGVTGRIVPVRDVRALASAILELLRDDEKRHAFGRAAREKALAEFDERHVFGRVIGTYEELLAARGRAAAAAQTGTI